jgi:hypothetical protein
MKWGPILGAAGVSIGLIINPSPAIRPASALSLELAKKCRAMALKAHPYKLPGEKGAGTAAAQRVYYNECVARGGDMPQGNSSQGSEGEMGQKRN